MSGEASEFDRDPQSGIMPAARMKPVLAKARAAPVNVAIGLTKAKAGVILLSARTPPAKLRIAMLVAARENGIEVLADSIRFGTGSIPPDDASVLELTLNKQPSGGLTGKLRVALRGTSCKKVVLAE